LVPLVLRVSLVPFVLSVSKDLGRRWVCRQFRSYVNHPTGGSKCTTARIDTIDGRPYTRCRSGYFVWWNRTVRSRYSRQGIATKYPGGASASGIESPSGGGAPAHPGPHYSYVNGHKGCYGAGVLRTPRRFTGNWATAGITSTPSRNAGCWTGGSSNATNHPHPSAAGGPPSRGKGFRRECCRKLVESLPTAGAAVNGSWQAGETWPAMGRRCPGHRCRCCLW